MSWDPGRIYSFTNRHIIPDLCNQTKDNILEHCKVHKGLFGRNVTYKGTFQGKSKNMHTNFSKLVKGMELYLEHGTFTHKSHVDSFLKALDIIEELDKQKQGFFAKHYPNYFGRAKEIHALRDKINTFDDRFLL